MKIKLLPVTIIILFILLSSILANYSTPIEITKAEKEMAKAITAEQLKDYLYFIASDAMGGRDTPSQGLDITAEFLAFNLKRWGFKPAGDNGTFFQEMIVRTDSMDVNKTKLSIGSKEMLAGRDFHRIFPGNTDAEANLVFCKDGWMIKTKNIDPCDNINVKDKIIVVYTKKQPSLNTVTRIPFKMKETKFPNASELLKATLKARNEARKISVDPITYANQKGAKGIILVASPNLQKFWSGIKSSATHLEKLYKYKNVSIPVFIVSQKVGEILFENEAGNQDSSSAFKINKIAKMNAVDKVERIPTRNVIALWEGSDHKLKNEMVAIGAHYDAQGLREDATPTGLGIKLKGSLSEIQMITPFSGKTANVSDDNIFNGADDDGSGTAAVIAIAEALAKAKTRPKRSVLLVWHTGEEKGLWGSKYFNEYPTVNINNIVAQLNLDMIGRSKEAGDTNQSNKDLSGPNEVYVIGSEKMSLKLGEVVKETNNAYLKMNYNYKYDDPKDPTRKFYRSDHYSYAQSGIPIAYWSSGTHQDYHGLGDSPDKIDYTKMEKITRTIFLTMWKLTELAERPKVDKQLIVN